MSRYKSEAGAWPGGVAAVPRSTLDADGWTKVPRIRGERINRPLHRKRSALSPEGQRRLAALVAAGGVAGAARILEAGKGTIEELASGGKAKPETIERLEARLVHAGW